jgi:hypothetical protein
VKEFDENEKPSNNEVDNQQFVRRKRSDNSEEVKLNQTTSNVTNSMNGTNEWKAIHPSLIIYTKNEEIVVPMPKPPPSKESFVASTSTILNPSLPQFIVDYWMFYPYSQGKTICTINLGILGPIPIPLIFNMCLGTKKEFGSHVGDWEHVSLMFRGGKMEPDVSQF